jgi:hypothetical protein
MNIDYIICQMIYNLKQNGYFTCTKAVPKSLALLSKVTEHRGPPLLIAYIDGPFYGMSIVSRCEML